MYKRQKEDKLDKERAEAYAARVKFDTAKAELDRVEDEISRIQAALAPLSQCERNYQKTLEDKCQEIKSSGSQSAEGIFKIEEEIGYLESQRKEVKEAVWAGQGALRTTEGILSSLSLSLIHILLGCVKIQHCYDFRNGSVWGSQSGLRYWRILRTCSGRRDVYKRQMLTYMEIAEGNRERGAFLRIINRPKRYVSRDAFDSPVVDLEKLKSFYQDRGWMLDRLEQLEYDLSMLKGMAPVAAVNYIRKAVGYDDYLREYAQIRRLKAEELLDTADQLLESASGYKTLDAVSYTHLTPAMQLK